MKDLSNYIYEKVDPKGQWDRTDDFFDEKSLGSKIWDLLYKYQKSGNPNLASKITDLLSDKFDGVKFTITTPNTGKVMIKAFDEDDNLLATLDEFEKDKIELPKIQEFLDKINK